MLENVFFTNAALRTRLLTLLERQRPSKETPSDIAALSSAVDSSSAPSSSTPIHVVITANEVNDRHGTGPLVQRVCSGWKNVFSIRARTDFRGVQSFGDWRTCIPQNGNTRAECFRNVLRVLRGQKIESVLCIPFLVDDFMTAIAIQEAFQAKLGIYIMDDQNVAVSNIPDTLMGELLERSSLRLVTHPELRHAYARKYRYPFYLLPAVVPDRLISETAPVEPVTVSKRRKGALMGSFWDQSWFDRLCSVLSGCNCDVDWFGNNHSPWVKFPPERMRESGIIPRGIIPEDQLAQELRRYPFVLVPAGALDEGESNIGVARLSLPGRILFVAAATRTPVLVVGSPLTCAARFVKHFGIGEVAPYDARQVSSVMDRLCEPDTQRLVRANAERLAPRLSDAGTADWLADSILTGRPADMRFENLFADYDGAVDLPKALSKEGM
jgi:hypothetical protein